MHPGNVLGQPAVVKSFDLAKTPLEEIKAPICSKFTMLVTRQGPVSGLAAFFDTAFKGSEGNPAETEVWTRIDQIVTGSHIQNDCVVMCSHMCRCSGYFEYCTRRDWCYALGATHISVAPPC